MANILIVSRNGFIGNMIKNYIEKDKHTCMFVKKYIEGIDEILKNEYDLVLFQASIDDYRGFVRIIREIDEKIPLCAGTFGGVERYMELLELTDGHVFFIPFHEIEIRSVVTEILSETIKK